MISSVVTLSLFTLDFRTLTYCKDYIYNAHSIIEEKSDLIYIRVAPKDHPPTPTTPINCLWRGDDARPDNQINLPSLDTPLNLAFAEGYTITLVGPSYGWIQPNLWVSKGPLTRQLNGLASVGLIPLHNHKQDLAHPTFSNRPLPSFTHT
ncbi:hypothetical protein O5D80_002557 [Batrachochytrium dendrobatidis]|nr:hypothetical protein O5D80_002557 [Batrachochytrium dendrobatidis]